MCIEHYGRIKIGHLYQPRGAWDSEQRQKILDNRIILPNRIHTADTQRCLENLGMLKSHFSRMKIIRALDLHLFLLSLFASQSFKHDYRYQRKNYFWEVGNTHINTLLRA